MAKKRDVSTNEIMESLKKNLVMRKEDILIQDEDKKVSALIELLKEKKVLSKEEAGVLLDFRPFPQSV